MNLLPAVFRVYLRLGPTDMRWGIDRLYWEVKREMGRDPYDGNLFLFFSRRRDRVKILHWDRGGFVLYYKRLEKGRFQFHGLEGRPELDAVDLSMLLSGIDVVKVKRPEVWTPGCGRKTA